jgi:hypothetical protein
MEARNILFQEEDKTTYVGKMMQKLCDMEAPQSILPSP